MCNLKEKTIDRGDGRQIVLETGKLARQADGAVLLKMGKTMLLATVVAAKEPKEDADFMPISADTDIIPDALAGLAASAALAVSDIPFNGPMSEVRVARVNNQFIVNPTATQMEAADIDLIVCATYDNILM